MRNILVTGGLGFIGSAFIRFVLSGNKYRNDKWRIINIDNFSPAANIKALEGNFMGNKECITIQHDISIPSIREYLIQYEVDAVINFAAETHVDKSITNPYLFIQTNVMGTLQLLKDCEHYFNTCLIREKEHIKNKFKFIQISTDEVFGSLNNLGAIKFNENSKYNPQNPYSVSKASADHLVRAWGNTYGLPYNITYSVNNYGPWQAKDKLIPKIIDCYLKGEKFPLYGNGSNFRDWIYVEDNVEGIFHVLIKGKPGESYCLALNQMYSNIDIVSFTLAVLNKRTKQKVEFADFIKYTKDRRGHDFGYGLDASKIEEELNWFDSISGDNIFGGLDKTISWYLKHNTEIPG